LRRRRRAPSAAVSEKLWRRAPLVRVYEQGDALCLLDDRGGVVELRGRAADVARQVLERSRVPRTEEDLLGGKGGPRRAVARTVLDVLQASGVLEEPPDEAATAPASAGARAHVPPRVVLALSGGVVAAYAPVLVEILLARGMSIRVAATPSALRFVSALALEALTHEAVVRSLWPVNPGVAVPHLELAEWADLIVVYPATATTLSRIARGDCSSVVSAIAVSTRVPVILVPAMNEGMFDAPSVRRNLDTLRGDGFVLTHPSFGFEVAAGPSARSRRFGAAPTVDTVARVIAAVLQRRPARG
jgi:hypothetical protein